MRDRWLSRYRSLVGSLSARRRALFYGILCLLPFLALTGNANAARDVRWAFADTVFHHVADDNALPNGASPLQIVEDGHGFLWEGSDDGLARYDGFHFRLYRPSAASPGSLPDSTISALHTDVRGRLWIGTSAGGLARYDGARDRFVTYAAGPHGLSGVSVRAIVDDGRSGLWIATNGGLDHLDSDSGAIRHLRHEARVADSLPDNAVHALLRDRRGTLWVGTRTGLVRLARGSNRFVTIRFPLAPDASVDVSALLEDTAGRIWIGTSANGAFFLERGETAASAVTESGPAVSALQNESVTAIAEARPGEVWLGTIAEGVVVLDVRSRRTHRIRHDPTLASSPADDSVHVLYRDPAGLLWMGTDRSLSYFDTAHAGVSTIFGPSSRSNGLTQSNIRSILVAHDGRVWFALTKDGVDIFDPRRGRVAALRPAPAHPRTALPDAQVYALAQTPSGDVFVATDGGLYRADAAGRHVARVTIPGRDPAASLWAAFYDAGDLWIGGENGVWKIHPSFPATTLLAPIDFRLTDQRVTVFARGPNHSLWIGTENGLNLYHPATRRVERFLPGRTDGALSAGLISALLTDAKGRLWVATQGGGIDVAEPRTDRGPLRFHHIGIEQGLPNNNVDKLLADTRGRIWASTDDGLAIVDARTFAVRNLGRAEGVAIAGYWLGSGAVTPEAEMLFGGLGGVTVVRPQVENPATYRPPIVLTEIRVGGARVSSFPYNGTDRLTTPLRILPSGNSLAVDFAALDYAAPEQIRFAYRLDGYERDWTYADATRRTASYTNLPPGRYALNVRATTRDGTWLRSPLALPLVVLPAWYQTYWFRLSALLAALAAIALLVKIRTQYLRRRQRDLERIVDERTAELQRRNAELAASTRELAERKRQLELLAYLDALTGLPNRRMFTDSFHNLVELMSRHDDRSFALLLIDLDRFKEVNDKLGHDAGDTLLAISATRLRAAVRQTDIVARFGGDEFAILLVDPADADGIEATCRRIVDSFAAGIVYKGQPVRSTPSIGVAVYPADGRTQDALYRSADLALYEAKRTGSNTWRWYLTTMGI